MELDVIICSCARIIRDCFLDRVKRALARRGLILRLFTPRGSDGSRGFNQPLGLLLSNLLFLGKVFIAGFKIGGQLLLLV